MILYPYTATALAESDDLGTDGKNIVAGAIITVKSEDGLPVVIYDSVLGDNGQIQKSTDVKGQKTLYLESGVYEVITNEGEDNENSVWITVGVSGGTGDSKINPVTGDNTELLTNEINALAETGGELYLGAGDFVITDTLPIYSNITLRGSGMPSYKTYWINIVESRVLDGKLVIKLAEPVAGERQLVTHRIMKGDVIKVFEFAQKDGIHEVFDVFPETNEILTSIPETIAQSPSASSLCRLSLLEGGTRVRFQNHITGEVTTNKLFFDAEDIRNLNVYDIGFVGPGISSVFGGGLRFRRIAEPDGRSRAITGYHWNNVLITHSAMYGVRFDQLIHSYLGHFNINRCVDDAIVFRGGPNGGATTSVHIDTPYLQNVRRGISMDIAAYCTITNPVVEGAVAGYHIRRGIGVTLNAMASETIKFRDDGQGGGVTGYFIDCYGTVINSPTVYYNTESDAWTKAALIFVDPNKRTESPTAVINGGHIHWSLGPKIPIVATRWSSRTGRVYLDVSNDSGYVPPDGGIGSRWVGNSFWGVGRQIYMTGVQRDSRFNERYIMTDLYGTPYVSSEELVVSGPPTELDDNTNVFKQPFTVISTPLSDAVFANSEVIFEFGDQRVNLSTGLEVSDNELAESGLSLQGTRRRAKIYYDTTGLAQSDIDQLNTDPFVFMEKGQGPFRTYWRDSTDGSRIGRYILLQDTTGDAKWIRSEYVYEVEFNGRDIAAYDRGFEPEGAFAYKLGRNYGVDVATDNVQRVIASYTQSNGRLNLKLDISHFHPVRFILTVNYNPYFEFSTGEYTSKAITIDNLDGVDYIRLEAIVGKDNGYINDDVIRDTNGEIELRFDENGPRTIIRPTKMKEDLASGNLFFYMLPTDYFSINDEFTVFKSRIKEFDGLRQIRNMSVSTASGLPCIDVETYSLMSGTNVQETMDDSVYIMEKFSAPVSNNITIDGLDSLWIFDDVNAIAVQDSRSGKAFASGTTTTVNVVAANNYDFHGHFDNKDGRVWVISQDENTVTFGHQSASSDRFTWFATRKKNVGLEAIKARQ